MKINHENIVLIEQWLNANNIQPQLTDAFIRQTYDAVLEDLYLLKNKESMKIRQRGYSLQYDFVRRDLLKILYKRNNFSAKGIKAGFVYAIGNPAWTNFIKIGSAIDVLDRLSSYQTSSPLRDFYLIDYFCTYDRLEYEKKIHAMFDRNSEWCKVDESEIRVVFKKLKSENNIQVLSEKLYAVKSSISEADKISKSLKEQKKVEKLVAQQNFAKRYKLQSPYYKLHSPQIPLPEIDY